MEWDFLFKHFLIREAVERFLFNLDRHGQHIARTRMNRGFRFHYVASRQG